ncbi:MAG: AEC family transporter [Thermodesulfobacteriota bacterium]|nr:AEC family transporter [Thermodesulfobacteriota bacterium]
MDTVALRTSIPLFILLGLGFLSRNIGILRAGDERVFSSYVYFFALPALFFINMAEISFSRETFRFMLASTIPLFVILALYLILFSFIRINKNTRYLLILSTIFGNVAFFGIPFIMFAFPTPQGERLAALSSASISIVGVAVSLTVLELYHLDKVTFWEGGKHTFKRLSRNPLILSIVCGILLSFFGIVIPSHLKTSLHMLGSSTSPVAIFMLGVFLYGRKYTNIGKAFALSSLRIFVLPLIAFITTTLLKLPGIEKVTVILMHSMPVAISMIVLSERYNFYEDVIASLILITSIGAGVYLNLWLFVLGHSYI